MSTLPTIKLPTCDFFAKKLLCFFFLNKRINIEIDGAPKHDHSFNAVCMMEDDLAFTSPGMSINNLWAKH